MSLSVILSMLWKYRRIGAYLVAAIAVGLLAWRVNSWRSDAAKLDAAVAALETERKTYADNLKKYESRQADSEKARLEFAEDNQRLRDDFAKQRAAIQPKTLVVTKEVPGAPCPDSRLSDDFRLLFNAAANVPDSS